MFQNKKLIATLLVIMVFSLISNWKYFFPKEKKAVVIRADQIDPGLAQAFITPVAPRPTVKSEEKTRAPGKKRPPYEQMLQLAQRSDWGPDPFGVLPRKPPSKPAVPEKSYKDEGFPPPPLEGLRLESILITPFNAVAVINNRLLEVGDSFMGKKVAEIAPGRVLLEGDGGAYELRLQEHKIPVKYIKSPGAEPPPGVN